MAAAGLSGTTAAASSSSGRHTAQRTVSTTGHKFGNGTWVFKIHKIAPRESYPSIPSLCAGLTSIGFPVVAHGGIKGAPFISNGCFSPTRRVHSGPSTRRHHTTRNTSRHGQACRTRHRVAPCEQLCGRTTQEVRVVTAQCPAPQARLSELLARRLAVG